MADPAGIACRCRAASSATRATREPPSGRGESACGRGRAGGSRRPDGGRFRDSPDPVRPRPAATVRAMGISRLPGSIARPSSLGLVAVSIGVLTPIAREVPTPGVSLIVSNGAGGRRLGRSSRTGRRVRHRARDGRRDAQRPGARPPARVRPAGDRGRRRTRRRARSPSHGPIVEPARPDARRSLEADELNALVDAAVAAAVGRPTGRSRGLERGHLGRGGVDLGRRPGQRPGLDPARGVRDRRPVRDRLVARDRARGRRRRRPRPAAGARHRLAVPARSRSTSSGRRSRSPRTRLLLPLTMLPLAAALLDRIDGAEDRRIALVAVATCAIGAACIGTARSVSPSVLGPDRSPAGLLAAGIAAVPGLIAADRPIADPVAAGRRARAARRRPAGASCGRPSSRSRARRRPSR